MGWEDAETGVLLEHGLSCRNWIRQYPALVNCTTIDWFSEWPKEALLEVAEKYLEGIDLGTVERGSLDTVRGCSPPPRVPRQRGLAVAASPPWALPA